MNTSQREDLAGRITAARISRFRGNRKEAYTFAKVNSATWTKAEEGVVIAERSLVAILLALWPETGGDWRKLDPPLKEGSRLADNDWRDYINGLGLSAETKQRVIADIEADRAAPRRRRKAGESA